MRDAIFGNDNGAYDIFVALEDNKLIVSGINDNSTFIIIVDLPEDAILYKRLYFVYSGYTGTTKARLVVVKIIAMSTVMGKN